MRVFPEPERGADDADGCMSASRSCGDEAVAWLARSSRVRGRGLGRAGPRRVRGWFGRRFGAAPALGLLVGLGLPPAAFAPAGLPAAQAHDRIDLAPAAARALAAATPADAPAGPVPDPGFWEGLPVVEQQPATTALIEDDLAGLPRATRDGRGDAVRFGQRSVPREVVDTIVRASSETGVDPAYMMALADKESSFETDARAATSSASGLFQFVTTTWLEMIRDHGARYGLAEEAAAVQGRGPGITVAGGMRERVLALRNDPRVAALMAAELIKRERGRIEARVGRAPTATDLYLVHLLGSANAGRFLSLTEARPGEAAAREFRSAARANRALFTAAEGRRRRSLTVAELLGRIAGMIDSRLSRYQGVTAVAEAADAAGSDTRRAETADAQAPGGV